MHTRIRLNLLRFSFSLLLLSLSALHSQAETYYVSLSGNDANPGTSTARAWATISKINTTHFQPGDSVLFEGGSTFEGGIYIHKGEKGEVSQIAGTAENPIVFGSYGAGWATISSGKVAGFKVYNAAGFKVERLIFSGAGRTINESFGIEFYMNVADKLLEYVYLDSVEVFGYREAGITITSAEQTTGGFKDVRITNSSSHDNGDGGIITYSQGLISHKNVYIGHTKAYNNAGIPDKNWSHSGSGITVGGADGAVIEYCVAYNNGWLNRFGNAGPIGIWGYHSKNLLIQFNEAYSNKTNSRTDGGGFDIDGGCTGCIMQYNYSHDNDGAGYVISQYKGAPPMNDVIVRYNISENDARKNSFGSILVWTHSTSGPLTGLEIYNNTIYISPSSIGTPSAMWVDVNSNSQVNLRNNIMVTTGNVKMLELKRSSSVRFEGNNYWPSDGDFVVSWRTILYTSLEAWRAATDQEMPKGNSIGMSIDPQLKDPGKGVIIGDPTKLYTLTGYELKESSGLIDKGLHLAKEFGLDIGTSDYFGNSLEELQEFTLGAFQPNKIVPLPVTLVSFTAKRQGDAALLEWETASEQDNRGFDVEVSLDGYAFRSLGFVNSKSTTSSLPQLYNFLDTEPAKFGTRYYRLRQVDIDGTATYSAIQALSFAAVVVEGVLVYPNPFKDELTLDVMAEKEEQLIVRMTDSMGRLVLNTSESLRIGSNSLRLSLPQQYPAGLYHLTARHGNKSYKVKLLSQGN